MLSHQLLGKTLANLLRVHPGTSNYIIHSKGEKSFCLFQKVSCNQETGCLLNCEFPEQKRKWFLGCSKVVKSNFTKLVKISSGLLETGRRHGKWSNQYKLSLHFSLPLSHLCYCNQFFLAPLLENMLSKSVVYDFLHRFLTYGESTDVESIIVNNGFFVKLTTSAI